ncbi:helix-turn-helix domain-containing protein [Streptomyces sp. NBC_00878]|uniref:helix-turn-helix domain-containing protein n=1 Tax=Streptomyces sp. NBC_00878 TaxID=2975854 RepID=UPI0022582671|nr:helix-turn-helix domain-containing protein [Streptomyces sp. NBC_00878]MCX4908101.1 helix-turn-helix domain-containing protein [Streptomyces sp. NBC_00878]
MDEQNPSAPPCAQPRIPRGITHINVRHTTRFTVIGNHLAQHRELSGLAIGLAVHIQSLPAGARADIKTLAARFPEGETRIAAALRELEAHGYLARTRERLPSGRVVTHTVSYNQPRGVDAQKPGPRPTSRPTPTSGHTPTSRLTPQPKPVPVPVPAPAIEADPAPVRPDVKVPPPPAADPRPRNPLPEPHTYDSASHRTATTLLASLHRDDPRLLLAERDVSRLAPAVTAWLERGAAPEAVRRTLTASLPEDPLRHPAGFLAHRLAELLPPPLPAAPAAVRAVRPLPLQNCDGCDRAFRAPEPGRCRGCRSDLLEVA